MEIKKIALITFSPCGGTKRVLEAITGQINLPKQEYDLTLPENRKKLITFEKDELVFIAFPVYSGYIPRNAEDIFNMVKGENTPAVLVAVYGNRAYEGAILDLHRFCILRGLKPVAACAAIAEHSMVADIGAHRPDMKDIQVLGKFGLDALNKAEKNPVQIEAPGKYPDPRPAPPENFYAIEADEDTCTLCGTCARVCPTNAISEDNLRASDSKLCIICMACMKYCPENARHFINPKVLAGASKFLEKFTERKEPEFFL